MNTEFRTPFEWFMQSIDKTWVEGTYMYDKLKKTTYTERQKKRITSSERRSLKFTPSKVIIFAHR